MTRFRFLSWLIPLAAVVIVAGVGLWSYGLLHRSLREQVSDQLQTILETEVTAIEVWVEGQRSTLGANATNADLESLVAGLVRLENSGTGASGLLRSTGLRDIRRHLDGIEQHSHYAGWMVISQSGRNIASSRDDDLAQRTLSWSPHVQAALEGATVVSGPFRSRTSAADSTGGAAMMIAAAPVRDAAGDVLAALVFRIDPAAFKRIIYIARMGASGETYVFDAQGMMVSRSRFDSELRSLGLLPADTSVNSTFNVEIRDPGGDLTRGFVPAVARRGQPLTRMAAEATDGNPGVDVGGYRDYRGVEVVGAWQWLPGLEIGIATEVDEAQAFGRLKALRRVFWVLILLSVLGSLGLFVYASVIARLRRSVETAQRLGQYRLKKKIGEGGMGKVYLAKHAMLRRPTAIKLIRADESEGQHVARFEREVQMTSSLTHPNTISIYDYGVTPEGVFYYAMELLRGYDLGQVVTESGPLPEARVIHTLRQACGSLAEAHALGLIHRDIKPANIMLCEQGGVFDFVKVLDFGLVRHMEQSESVALTQAESITGTPLYLSPEQIVSPDKLDERSDIYALGAVGYYLLTGEPVFTGYTPLEVCSQHISTPPERPSSRIGRQVTPDLEALILQCLAKDRDDRPAGAEALMQALEACADAPKWKAADARAWWAARAVSEGGDLDLSPRIGRTDPSRLSGSADPTLEVDFDDRSLGKT